MAFAAVFRSSAAPAIIVLAIASLLAVTEASRIVVGGSQQWRYGFNYTDWAIQNSPFYIYDTLVFKYEAPSEIRPAHSVYLLPNLSSYINCDFTRAKLLSNPTQGKGEGFAFEINELKPHYFASGEGDDCEKGMMKLIAVPWPRV